MSLICISGKEEKVKTQKFIFVFSDILWCQQYEVVTLSSQTTLKSVLY